MNLKPAKVGAEPRKLVLLGVLLAAAGYFFWSNMGPGDEGGPGNSGTAARPAASQSGPDIARDIPDRPVERRDNVSLDEFRPSMKRKKDEVIDPARIDPTLKLDLLAKVRDVPVQGGQRSIFDFTAAPPPPVAPVKPGDKKKLPLPSEVARGPAAPVVATPPPPPPIPLKFYGFVSASARKSAFFLDGDDIVVAGEGDVIKKRYKVVRIGIGSAVVEDEQSRHEQTLPLVAEQQEG